eukprot:gene47675-62024_t
MTPDQFVDQLFRWINWAIPKIGLGAFIVVPIWFLLNLVRPPKGSRRVSPIPSMAASTVPGFRMAKKKKPTREVASNRGVPNADAAADWLESRGLEDIECLVPDMTDVPRGKMIPVEMLITAKTMSLPGSIFLPTITG